MAEIKKQFSSWDENGCATLTNIQLPVTGLWDITIYDSLRNIYSNDNLDLSNSEESTINMGGSSEEWIAEIGFDIDNWINLAVQTIPGRDDIPTQGILTLQLDDTNNDFFDFQLTGSSDVEGDWKSQIQLFWRY